MNFNFKLGDHVRITPNKPNGEAHPQAGKTGIIKTLHTIFLRNASVLLDEGQPDAGRIAIVSLGSLELIPFSTRGTS